MYGFDEKLKKKIYYLENKDMILKKRRIYVENNKDLVKQCKENSRKKHSNYVRKPLSPKNKTEKMLRRHRNKCAKLGLRHDLSFEQYEDILTYFNNSCAFCDNEEVYIGYIIPYSKGKGFYMGNVIPICARCRSSKRDRNLTEWTAWEIFQKYYPEKAKKVIEYKK